MKITIRVLENLRSEVLVLSNRASLERDKLKYVLLVGEISGTFLLVPLLTPVAIVIDLYIFAKSMFIRKKKDD